jgi:adenosylhomocysteine nucleosidase
MTGPLALLTACAHEAALVRRLLCVERQATCSAGRLWQGSLQAQAVILLQYGMGPRRATQAVHWLCQHSQPYGVFSVGFAGGLQTELATGDALLSTAFLSQESDGTMLRPDARLAHLTAMAVAQTTVVSHSGPLLSTASVVAQASTKRTLGCLSGALAVDMESYSIGQTAAQYRLPFAVLRTIFDPAHRDFVLPVAACTTATGALRPLRLLTCLIAQPLLCLQLPQWWWASQVAGRHLQQWLRAVFLLLRQGA